MLFRSKSEDQKNIIFKPGGMLRFLAGMTLKVDHLELWFHNGFKRLAKEIQGEKDEIPGQSPEDELEPPPT